MCALLADDENMDEARNSSTNAPQPISMNISRQLDNGGDGEGAGGGLGTDEDDSDVGESPAPFLSRRDKKPHLPHPFKRSVSSPVDEKVEDLLRTSRHRLLADASVGVTPGQCRAITVYNPVLLPGGVATGGEGETSCDSDGEAGGDPTPSPGATGNDGDKRAAVSSSCSSCSSGSPPASSLNTARVCSAAGGAGMGMLQCAGSGTAEGVRSGSCGGDRSQGHSGDRDFFSGGGGGGSGGGPRGLQTGGGLAHSAADVAAGPMTDDNDEIGDGGAAASLLTSTAGALIAVTTANDAMEDDDIMGTLPGISNQPALTRMGTSRGAPTPEITPEWVALARVGYWKYCSSMRGQL